MKTYKNAIHEQFEFSMAIFFCPNAVFGYYTLPINENVRLVWEESSAIHDNVLRFVVCCFTMTNY